MGAVLTDKLVSGHGDLAVAKAMHGGLALVADEHRIWWTRRRIEAHRAGKAAVLVAHIIQRIQKV
jgi:hypothetical protein